MDNNCWRQYQAFKAMAFLYAAGGDYTQSNQMALNALALRGQICYYEYNFQIKELFKMIQENMQDLQ